MKHSGRNPFRIFLWFALGIILPSGFLSYLGFRSFQYEGKVLQQETKERYESIAQALEQTFTEECLSLVQDVRKTLSTLPIQRNKSPYFEPLLSLTLVRDLPVQAVYLWDAEGKLVYPILPATTAPKRTIQALNWGIYEEAIQRLEQVEFVEKDYPTALRGYDQLLKAIPEPALRSALYKNKAGVERKLKQWADAERTYQTWITLHANLMDPAGYPVGILGRQLLINLYKTSGQVAKATALEHDLAEKLLWQTWPVDGPFQERFWNDATANPSNTLADLKPLAKRLSAQATQAKSFLSTQWPTLERRIQEKSALKGGGILHATPQSFEPLYLWVPFQTPGGESYRALLQVEGSIFEKTLFQKLTLLTQTVGLTMNAQTSKLVSSFKPTLTRSIPAVDPPYELRLSDDGADTRQSFQQRRLWIYGGMIGLSLLVILVGLGIMAHAMRREVEVANLKADFVANVSHELRTPLAAISYIGERLTAGRYRSPDEVKEFYGMLGEETGRLRELIEDVLDFSKMLSGKRTYEKEPIDLVDIAREVTSRFHGKAELNHFTIHWDLPANPIPLLGDRRALMQAWLNLLDNALKYSGDSKRIEVTLSASKHEAKISVRDYGIGIDSAEREKIFEKFYRVEHAMKRTSEGGVGLGLAMVDHIIKGHGGQVTVHSELGKGSTFSLTIPLVPGK